MLDLDGLTRSFRTQTSLKSRAYSKWHRMGQERVGGVALLSPARARDLTSLT